jgi:hypothetical protein
VRYLALVLGTGIQLILLTMRSMIFTQDEIYKRLSSIVTVQPDIFRIGPLYKRGPFESAIYYL